MVTPPAAVQNRRLLALWLVATSVLVWVPGGASRFVLGKLLVLALACLVGSLVPRDGRLPRSVAAGLAVGAAVVALAALVGATPLPSLVGRFPRYEGLPVLALYAAAAWLGARIGGRGPARAVQLAHALSGVGVVLGLLAVLELGDITALGAGTPARSGSVLGNATDQAAAAAMVTLVAAGALALRRDPLLLAGVAGGVVTVALSGSRLGLAVTAVGLTAVALRRRSLLRPLGVALSGLVAVAVAVPATRDRLLSTSTGRGRLEQWRLTWELVRDHPWLGIGPSRYVDAVGRYETAEFVAFTGPRTLADSPHSVVLQALVVGGVPLLACLVVLTVLVLRRALAVVHGHPEALGALAAVLAFGVLALANPTAAGPTGLAAFLAGVLLAEPAPGPEPAWPRRAVSVLAAAGAVAALTACVGEVQLGHRPPDRASAEAAQRWRPWDSDTALVAAELALPTDPALARDLAEQALEATPESYEGLVTLGLAERRLGDEDAARRHLDHAAALFPERRVPG